MGGATVFILKRQRTIKKYHHPAVCELIGVAATMLTQVRTLLGPLTRHNQSMSPVIQQQHLSHVKSYTSTANNWGQWKRVLATPSKSSSWGSAVSVYLSKAPFSPVLWQDRTLNVKIAPTSTLWNLHQPEHSFLLELIVLVSKKSSILEVYGNFVPRRRKLGLVTCFPPATLMKHCSK